MRQYKFTCDKCSKEEITKSNAKPTNWKSIELDFDRLRTRSKHPKEFHLCEECSKKLGFNKTADEGYDSRDKRIEDKLLDIFTEIVEGIMENNYE